MKFSNLYTECPVLTKEEEFAAWERGDHDLLIRSQLPFVVSIATTEARKFSYRGIDDCIAEGNLALVRCVREKFDASKGFRLSTYCQWTVWQTVRKFIFRSRRLPTDYTVEANEVQPIVEDEDKTGLKEEMAALRNAVSKLQPNRKNVIKHIIDGKSMIEIGGMLGCTRQAVHLQFKKAVCDLRRELAPSAN